MDISPLPSTSTLPPLLPPITRGRPRSTSISSGSPSPIPNAQLPPPSLFPDCGPSPSSANRSFRPPAKDGKDSSLVGGGWGHRPTLLVPNVLAPLAVSPGGGRVGRHRRTQSVSPPGFPVIFENGAGSRDNVGLAGKDHIVKPIPISIPISRSPGYSAPLHSPTSFSPPSSSFSSSPRSPHGSYMTHHNSPQSSTSHGFPSSHSALLSGVRSHALPSSPMMDVTANDYLGEAFSPRSPNMYPDSGPDFGSPPFGPTPSTSHFPSPLSLDSHRSSPVFTEERRRSFDEVRPPIDSITMAGRNSPPLPPVTLGVAVVVGRGRSGSFGQVSPPSPALQYLEKDDSSVIGHCDQRASPTETHSVSPPPSPPLFPTPASAGPNRPRSRSFTSERNFAPIQPNPFIVPALGPTSNVLPPPPSAIEGILPPADIIPPPSPHHATISLPPPLVAPAPLPPHLGGPPLHNVQAKSKHRPTKLSSAEHIPRVHSPLTSPGISPDSIVEPGLDVEIASGGEGGSPVIEEERLDDEEMQPTDIDSSSERGAVERELSEAESTQMDLGASTTHLEDFLSPCGLPEHFEVSTYGSAYLELGSSSHTEMSSKLPHSDNPQFVDAEEGLPVMSNDLAFIAAVSRGPDGQYSHHIADSIPSNLSLSRTERERSISPSPVQIEASNASSFGTLGFIDVDELKSAEESSGLGLDTGVSPNVTGGTSMMQSLSDRTNQDEGSIDEESLSVLERIFICAKSENGEQRARVAYHLADWLQAVDICEAVEYVLPLLAGLATDSEEIVKEVFSPQLDRIMWHFFSQCPLMELNTSDSPEANEEISASGSPIPSRYTAHLEDLNSGPPSTHFSTNDDSHSSAFTPTPTSTTETSPSHSETADSPRISATSFTSLLGALLTDQSTLVAKATQVSLVRFLCRLKGKPLPPSVTASPDCDESMELPSYDSQQFDPNLIIHRSTYQITPEARKILEDEVVTGIVLGLARLDDDDREEEKSMPGTDEAVGEQKTAPRTESLTHLDEDRPSSILVLSPEEEQIDDTWLLGSEVDTSLPVGHSADSWGADPLISYFDDSLDMQKSDAYLQSSPNQHIYSTFSPDGQGDEESAIGKMVSMSLIAAIAAADCLESDVLVQQILPEVDRMKAEPMFYVRKEAMTALGCLARTLPIEVFESSVLPLQAAFAKDSLWQVRRAACLALPAICGRLPPALLRSQVILNIQTFSNDASRNVRSGALEVCGELIYLFHGVVGGVPEELLAFFLGQTPADAAAALEDSVFAPLPSALDAPDPFFDSVPDWTPAATISTSRDPDRPVMCAFNFPAVVLTLGRDQWPKLQPCYAALSEDKADKVRQSLASSMHEIAKIIGPEQSDASLFDPFTWFLHDYAQIQTSILANLSSLLRCFSLEAGKQALRQLGEAWSQIKNWRLREAIAKELAGLGDHFVGGDAVEEVLSVLAKAFKDPVAAVREMATQAIPSLFAASEDNPSSRGNLWAFLSVFSEDASYRNRMLYTSCVLATIRAGLGRDIFESHFADPLSRLAQDNVITVRIGVARAVAEACRSESLYADSTSRGNIQELLSHLAHSQDRDVRNPILPYYFSEFSSPPPSSPPPTGLDRSGAHSRMDLHENDHDEENILPHTNPNGMGSRWSLDDTMEEETAGNSSLNAYSSSLSDDSNMSDSSSDGDRDGNSSDVDMENDMDVLLQEEENPSPLLWTRELEGDEEFVEISRR